MNESYPEAFGSDVGLAAELLRRLRPFREDFPTLVAELEQFQVDCAATARWKRKGAGAGGPQ